MEQTQRSLQGVEETLIQFFEHHENKITEENYRELRPVLSPETVLALIDEVVASPLALERIARNSYVHSLGFVKIVFLYSERVPGGFELRLHIWWPQEHAEAAAPAPEGKHEHGWDFVSTVLAGLIENQRYRLRALLPEELAIFKHFEKRMMDFSPSQVAQLLERLDQLETLRLAHTSSRLPTRSGGVELIQAQVDIEGLQALTRLSASELETMTNIYIKYSNQREEGSTLERYAPSGKWFVAPVDVQLIPQGETYFHPQELGHRLFIPPEDFLSTLLVTGPAYPDKSSGELVHTTVGKEENSLRERTYYTPDTLRDELLRYRKVLVATYFS